MSNIVLPASFMLFLILPRKLQIFCNVFCSILYTADLSTGLSEIANPSRSVSPALPVSSESTDGSSKLDSWKIQTNDFLSKDGQIMLKLESSLARRDNPEILGKW